MTYESLLQAQLHARENRQPCVLATVAAVRGSVPRHSGAKALVFSDGRIQGTIGGGKFESLVIQDALQTLASRQPLLKTYPLHELSADSFGAICGGEVTVLLEPQLPREGLIIFGAGHCGQALCKLARDCNWHVTLIDDREELLAASNAHIRHLGPAPEFIAGHAWQDDEALVLVSRNYQLDLEALHAALLHPGAPYIGMIGSRRKVETVFKELRQRGIPAAALEKVHAPIGLDIAADCPAEIAVSILAEVMGELRKPRSAASAS